MCFVRLLTNKCYSQGHFFWPVKVILSPPANNLQGCPRYLRTSQQMQLYNPKTLHKHIYFGIIFVCGSKGRGSDIDRPK
jgi:hypothetical protein